jgi:hypothetical protein
MPKLIMIIPMTILGLVFIQGLLNAVNPRFLWRIFESWKSTKEPASSYFISRRIFGIFTMLIVAAVFLFPYIMSKL